MDPRDIYDSQVENETSFDEFVLRARMPSLQEMSFLKLAVAVCCRYRSTPSQRRDEPRHIESAYTLGLMDCHKMIKTVAIPRFMKVILKKYVKRVREEIIRCTNCFEFEVDWQCLVWCPEGRINYTSTAIKMLHSQELTEVQKFAIMCRFCLENEIKSFDLNRLPDMETSIAEIGDRYSLLSYWISYLKNDLHSVTPCYIRLRDHSARFHLLYHLVHGAAFEYFWDRLHPEDQVSFISTRLSTYSYYRHWRHRLLYKMSHDQLTTLLSRQPITVISLLIKGMDTREWPITAWKLYKNRISDEQFFELLKSVLDRSDENLKHILRQERKMSVLLEIWNTANDRQKDYATRWAYYVVRPILSTNSKLAPSTFKFLLTFLSLTSANFRANLILDDDPSFIFNFDLDVVHEIFELCLPNSQHRVGFENARNKYTIRPYFGKILYSEEDHDELNRRLLGSFQNLNIPSNDTLKNCVESLITGNKRDCDTYYPYNGNGTLNFLGLSKFMNKTLQEDVSTVLTMKQSYISSFSTNIDPYERYGSLNKLSKLIEQEFVHEHVQLLKHRLAETLQTIDVEKWVKYVYMYYDFTDVFSWCFENEEEMFLQVKRCIPIYNIIGKVFERIVRESSSYSFIDAPFSTLERFVEWYFSGEAEKVISFKLSIMNDPEIAKILECVQQKKYHEGLRRKFLQWNWLPQVAVFL